MESSKQLNEKRYSSAGTGRIKENEGGADIPVFTSHPGVSVLAIPHNPISVHQSFVHVTKGAIVGVSAPMLGRCIDIGNMRCTSRHLHVCLTVESAKVSASVKCKVLRWSRSYSTVLDKLPFGLRSFPGVDSDLLEMTTELTRIRSHFWDFRIKTR